jgi:hypothetical protein
MKSLISYEGSHCANCGTPMQGEFCHHCGQSIRHVLKPVHGMLDDTLDMVFNIDSRVLNTIPPLFVRPGFLTLEYFAGRRARYVAPFRLMFLLCLLALFVCQISFTDGFDFQVENDKPAVVSIEAFKQAHSVDEVQQALQKQLADLEALKNAPKAPGREAIRESKHNIQQQAKLRLHELAAATARDEKPATSSTSGLSNPFSRQWNPQQHPVTIGWLPDFANHRLQQMLVNFHANMVAFRSDDEAVQHAAKQRVTNAMFGVLPATMFVLTPIFALLLKLFYVFKRRLYMEHLIVSLHSHAFLFLGLLLGVLVHLLSAWLTPYAAWLGKPLGWVQAGLWVWAPVYLLIMQKRVYRQGWPMTILKYLVIGWCYMWLLVLVVLVAAFLGMAN